MTATMKAVRFYRYGAADVLVYEDAPRPEAGASEVLIRIHAAGVNPVDWKTREGRGVAGHMPDFPIILGWDVSGVVEGVGPDVSAFRPGDAVYGMIRFPHMGAAYAEYASAPVADLAAKPASLNHAQAAGVPLAALTAWQALFDAANLQTGQRVLIHAAAGGVGHLAVQLAKWKGAYVIGTASARNARLLCELGVDQVIDYTATRFETVTQQVDVVLDTVGGETLDQSFSIVRPGGSLISIVAHPSEEHAATAGIRARNVIVKPASQQLAELAQLIDAGNLRPLIDVALPLAQARAAHEQSQSGHARGKIVLQVRKE